MLCPLRRLYAELSKASQAVYRDLSRVAYEHLCAGLVADIDQKLEKFVVFVGAGRRSR